MSKIILSEEAQNGIQGVTQRKMKISKSYQKLIDEADQKIDESRSRYANAYKKATSYLARS